MVTLTHAIACHSMCGNLDGWGGGGGGGGGIYVRISVTVQPCN